MFYENYSVWEACPSRAQARRNSLLLFAHITGQDAYMKGDGNTYCNEDQSIVARYEVRDNSEYLEPQYEGIFGEGVEVSYPCDISLIFDKKCIPALAKQIALKGIRAGKIELTGDSMIDFMIGVSLSSCGEFTAEVSGTEAVIENKYSIIDGGGYFLSLKMEQK